MTVSSLQFKFEGVSMRRFCTFLFVRACTSAVMPVAHGQTGKGTVAGTVKDSGNSALPGALVDLLPLGRKVVTDDHGQFRITDVPAGEYTLSVSYVGLAVSNTPVVVEAGKEFTANPALQVASQSDQVVVRAERLPGEAEALDTASTDAGGARGTVHLVSGTAGERPTYALGGTGGYNPIQNGYGRGGFYGTLGKRFGTSKKLGFLLNGTFDKTKRGIDDLEPSQAVLQDAAGNNFPVSNGEEETSHYYHPTRYSLSPAIHPQT